MENLIKVLWVENDSEVLSTYPGEAEQYGLRLVPFECWDDAEKALRTEYRQWEAIILDAKCKLHKDSLDQANKFLVNVTNTITRMAKEEGRFIPWYILSGQAEYKIADLIPEDRLKWDKDWTKAFYDKNIDREMLFHRIKIYVERKSQRYQLKMELYPKVFMAIEKCGLNDEVEPLMEDLLLSLNFGKNDGMEMNEKFLSVRKIFEYVFYSMIEHGILPFEKYVKGNGKDINKKCCSMLLDGKEWKDKNNLFSIIPHKQILPPILANFVKSALDVTNESVHSNNGSSSNNINLHNYLVSVGNSPFLIHSYALMLCDLLLWYHKYLEENPDKEVNTKGWEIQDNNKTDIL